MLNLEQIRLVMRMGSERILTPMGRTNASDIQQPKETRLYNTF